ncbi:metallophosphoesterase family protein [candidate division KSB1 bacterium]|nr:metallophosphoesterase family protein [candidate division KSB1 bacterium]
MKTTRALLLVFLTLVLAETQFAHDKHHPSVYDAVAKITQRMSNELTPAELKQLSEEKVLDLLTAEERKILSSGFLCFKSNRSVTVYVAVRANEQPPFWLAEQKFSETKLSVNNTVDGEYKLWRKKFDAGEIGLGVHSLYGGGRHYVVFVKPKSGTKLKISDLYPGQHEAVEAKAGAKFYIDRDGAIENLPTELAGATLIQTLNANRDVGRLLGVLYTTRYPSTAQPDQIVLSWTENPRTTQTISWRSDTTITSAAVFYQPKNEFKTFIPKNPQVVGATTTRLETPELIGDRVVHRHHATLRDLKPHTTYVYSVGSDDGTTISDLLEFTTAPDNTIPFSFMYLGDAQNGLDRWGSLMKTAHRMRPDVAFILMAGDQVNRGAQRDDWDDLFHNGALNFATKPLMTTIGNHECQGGYPGLYLKILNLPINGPKELEPERAYSFEYGNALFVVLDSNEDPNKQTRWLDSTLTFSSATWKFALFHHPIYSSKGSRDNPELRNAWAPIFDKHHVDMVLQGHDHAYLRTHPMRDNKRVSSPKEGTVYVVSFSGMKMYDQQEADYTAVGFTKTATFQILDIQLAGNRLLYRSYNADGNLVDDLEILK